MKLKELNEAIATKCNVRVQVVNTVQAETFRTMQAALDKGEKVIVPDFGHFSVKDVAGEDGAPDKKVVRFRSKTGEKKEREANPERKAERQKKKAEAKAAKAG
jgi:nucleoid DNA-binding protein